ncbi:hypothetical protein NEMBOFW57_009884 [Staphylotrichum longicolle]|uniref:Uncharacterized protein n=1 Tax=Staphylotrichum longicolle TaxID=669026 RepID=A0AAD4ETV3_9PEZI|nr:hypothetical protein NEMBOFW57_009884 [Staphylotrichum longicolle]
MAKPTPAARLRKTFHYPSDDDDNPSSSSTPEVLDEQEQESLIAKLSTQNTTRNASFLRLLSILPPLSSVPFLLGLFLPTNRDGGGASPFFLLPLLGLSSLLATGWMLHRLGPTETGLAFFDQQYQQQQGQHNPRPHEWASGSGSRTKPRTNGILTTGQDPLRWSRSPLEQHLPRLNLALAALALLTGLLERAKLGPAAAVGVSPVLLGALPGVVYAVVVGAKVVMAGVDPERELDGLRYGYKGA